MPLLLPVFTRCTRRVGTALVILWLGMGPGWTAEPYEPQEGDPLLEPWRLRTYPEMTGLGADCMTESSDGALWFGTSETFWRYDGFDWADHPTPLISGGSAKTLCRAADGSLYAGGPWGIIVWRGGEWSRVFPAERPGFAAVRKLVHGREG
ncbi:MAG: hypothetical protein IAE82_02340, partial [Opitutaceae bacterium]|nr:hypothetical protein [Opitutaceae bacterium]